MSCLLVRARAQITGPWTSRAIACTDSKSPGEVIGKPASITSTPRRASWWAISSFSCLFSEIPGDCSPSRRVVSKIRTRSAASRRSWRCLSVGRCSCRVCSFCISLDASSLLGMRLRGRHALFPPKGEQEKREKRDLQRHRTARLAPAPAGRQGAQPSSTDHPLTNPSEATISRRTASGTGASVVTTIAARRWRSSIHPRRPPAQPSPAPPSPGSPSPAPLRRRRRRPFGGVTDRGRGDVDAVRAEDRADPADHARQVLVAEDGHVRLKLDRQPPALHLDEVGHAVGADARAGDDHALGARRSRSRGSAR